ncbi:MAG TPA: homocysteine S-methyltransferase family protein [Amycolatopsis sp.]|nr:homocysteine S-methyltransferase family protein [Amycolatopsis sp.]
MNDPLTAEPMLLDGGLATEIQRAGQSMRAPWWTTRCLLTDANRRVLRSVHEAYLAAGARVITAATFRCTLRSLRQTRLDEAGYAWMVHAAIGVARAARSEAGIPGALIAGSVGPVEDCYRPDLVPPDDELAAEHGWLARQLSRSGVDLFLIETMNTLREARIALDQALAVGGRAWVSFVCDEDANLLSGEKLTAAAQAVERDGAEAVLVNCTSPSGTETALRALRAVRSGPVGVYPNIEDRRGIEAYRHVDRYLSPMLSPDEYADLLAAWRADHDVDLLGGCCGSSPAHLAALHRRLSGPAVGAA